MQTQQHYHHVGVAVSGARQFIPSLSVAHGRFMVDLLMLHHSHVNRNFSHPVSHRVTLCASCSSSGRPSAAAHNETSAKSCQGVKAAGAAVEVLTTGATCEERTLPCW